MCLFPPGLGFRQNLPILSTSSTFSFEIVGSLHPNAFCTKNLLMHVYIFEASTPCYESTPHFAAMNQSVFQIIISTFLSNWNIVSQFHRPSADGSYFSTSLLASKGTLDNNFDLPFCCNFSKHGSIMRLKRILSLPEILWIQWHIPIKFFDLIKFYLFPFESCLMFVELFANWCWCEATTYPHQFFCSLERRVNPHPSIMLPATTGCQFIVNSQKFFVGLLSASLQWNEIDSTSH